MTQYEKKLVHNANELLGDITLALQDFVSYANSTKFHNDTTMQVQDIQNRIGTLPGTLQEVSKMLLQAQHPKEKWYL